MSGGRAGPDGGLAEGEGRGRETRLRRRPGWRVRGGGRPEEKGAERRSGLPGRVAEGQRGWRRGRAGR